MENDSYRMGDRSVRGLLDRSEKPSNLYNSVIDESNDASFFPQSTLRGQAIDLDAASSSNIDIQTFKEIRQLELKSKPSKAKLEDKGDVPEDYGAEEIFGLRDPELVPEPQEKKRHIELIKIPSEETIPSAVNSDRHRKSTEQLTLSVPRRGSVFQGIKAQEAAPKRGSFSSLRLFSRASKRGSSIGNNNLDSPGLPKPPPSPNGKINFFGLIAMARRMGLMRRANGYEDYVTNDQFNMIKDFSTGRFDSKEEKRLEQMTRLKMKLMLNTNELGQGKHKHQRRKTHLIDWQNNLMPTLKVMYKNFKKQLQKVIPPNGVPRMLWDLAIMLMIFYDLIMVPLTLTFPVDLPSGFAVWDLIENIFFLLDIVLNFNTGFYYKGMLVMDRRRIIISYLKGWFYIDLAASIPYEYMIAGSDGLGDSSYQYVKIVKILKVLRFLRFLRVFKLKRIFIKIESYIDMSNALMSIIAFIKLCLIILFIAHWIACAFYEVGTANMEYYPETWLTRRGIEAAPWFEQYVASFYWAASTMITVGYGDIAPVTIYEELVAVAAMMVASAVFAYTMNRINIILAGLETTNEQYQRALSTITDYMRKKHVKKELQIKIKKYLEYALQVETSFDSNESYLNVYLNQSLKNELITEIHGKMLLENPIFMRFDNHLIMKASMIVKEKIFSPEDPIFLENSYQDDSSIYIIQSGKVEIFDFRSNSFLRALSKGHHFGEMSFFTGFARISSARSTDFSSLYLLKRDEFIEVLNEFPSEKEKFFEIKDKICLYHDHRPLGVKCYSCGSMDHLVKDCPKVHVIVPKEKYLMSYIEKKNSYMKDYIRTGMRGDRREDRYVHMVEAAQRIQVRIWEGDLQLDNALLYTLNGQDDWVGLAEHPSALLMKSKRQRRTIPNMNLGEAAFRRTSTESFLRPDSRERPSLHSMDFDELAVEPESKKLRKKQLSVTILNSNKKDKKNIFDDIDRIHNFRNYFPHNNFTMLHPIRERRRNTRIFDYFSQESTNKETLKKFINILKEKVRIRREAAAKELANRRPSLFGKLLPIRSKFYKERGNSGSPKSGKFGSPKSSAGSMKTSGFGSPSNNSRIEEKFEDYLSPGAEKSAMRRKSRFGSSPTIQDKSSSFGMASAFAQSKEMTPEAESKSLMVDKMSSEPQAKVSLAGEESV